MLNKSEAVKGKGKESKENSVVTKKSKKDNQLNEEKLKEYVLEKERTEKILATQCVKLEGLIKMMQIINPVIFRVSNDAFSELKTKDTS